MATFSYTSVGLRSCRSPALFGRPRFARGSSLRPSQSRHGTCNVLRRCQSTATGSPAAARPIAPRGKGFGFFKLLGLSIIFTTSGYLVASLPPYNTLKEFFYPPSDAEALRRYLDTAPTSITHDIDTFISASPIIKELRANPNFTESRPHMTMQPALRPHNFTGGVLAGPGKIVVPPYLWLESGGKSMVSVAYIGGDVCGHPGVIHGGVLATLLDEGLAMCCFAALPNKIAMTANLTIDYRKPAPAGSFLILKAKTVKVEGRKAWVEGTIETLVKEGETPVLIAEAKALYIEPRNAKYLPKIIRV